MTALSDAYAMVAAVESAHRLGLLASLAHAPASAEELAREHGLGARATFKLLEALEALGVLEVDRHGRFGSTGALGLVEALRCWDHLTDRLTRGRRTVAVESAEGADTFYPRIATALAEAFAALAEHVADELAGLGTDVLDVAAGAATWSLPLALRDPGCRLTLLDRPGVLEVASARLAAAGCAERFELLAGDLEGADFGRRRYDLVLAGNVCHLLGGSANTRLFQRLLEALRAGGTLVVIDATPGDYESPAEARLHALSLMLRTTAGDVHPFSSYCGWLLEAGFHDVDRRRLRHESVGISLIRARKGGTGEEVRPALER